LAAELDSSMPELDSPLLLPPAADVAGATRRSLMS
jgi:hypothetical protein